MICSYLFCRLGIASIEASDIGRMIVKCSMDDILPELPVPRSSVVVVDDEDATTDDEAMPCAAMNVQNVAMMIKDESEAAAERKQLPTTSSKSAMSLDVDIPSKRTPTATLPTTITATDDVLSEMATVKPAKEYMVFVRKNLIVPQRPRPQETLSATSLNQMHPTKRFQKVHI